jgi:F-type H+-transporting ATPase subunit b
MQIDGWTLALQAVNFLVLVWLLQRFLYKPVRAILAQRKEAAAKAFAEAERHQQEADAAKQRFEAAQAALAQERQDMLRDLHREQEAERDKLLQSTRDDAERTLVAARKQIDEERDAALAELRKQAADLAVDLAATLLRKAAPTQPDEALLQRIEAELQGLPEEERARLRDDLAADGARLTVVTAAALPNGDRDRWRQRLAACLGGDDRTDFVTDPEIIGGAELRLPHAVLKFSLADQLAKAKEALQRDATAS